MLERITLRNFQTHERLTVDLDPHITSVVGKSDVGKSAIIRALRWVAQNRPAGEAFVRHGSAFAKVTLTVDGREVRRKKGKGVNTYHLDGKPLKAFGSDVPDEIAGLLNIGDTNFQGQHDAPFWFSESAGTVSRSLNSIINLGVIDDTLAALAGRQREAVAGVATAGARLDAARGEWKTLKPVKKMDRDLRRVEVLADHARQAQNAAILVRSAVADALGYQQRAKNAANRLEMALRAVRAGDEWADLAGRYAKLSDLVAEGVRWQAVADCPVYDVDGLLKTGAGAMELASRRDALSELVSQADNWEERRRRSDATLADLEKRLQSGLGERCPLCGNKIKLKR